MAGDNFACGSSREHAPWALVDYGFRAVISTSFADIFRNNSLKNGLLPIIVDPRTHAAIMQLITDDPKSELTIDWHPTVAPAGWQAGVFSNRPILEELLTERCG